MIVYVYPADPYACGHVRLIWPASANAAQGHDIRVIMPNARRGIGGQVDESNDELVGVMAPEDADVVVLQRVSMKHLAQAVPLMRAKGIAVVVDMDDDLTRIDPANPAFKALSSTQGDPRHSWKWAAQACMDATLVTVSAPALLKVYAPHGRGMVLENRVPAGYLGIPHHDSAVFGWPGAIHSHPRDLHEVGPAVARLVRAGYEYRGVGVDYCYTPGDGGLRKALGLEVDPPTTGDVDLNEWPLKLAELGIGLAPLADTQFNGSKSWLKPLDLMACGVPWVASPRAEYVRLQQRTGVGLLARNPKEWFRFIKKLADDGVMRQEMSEAGRVAAADMTFEGNAWQWLEAWESALIYERHRRGRAVLRRYDRH